MTAEEIAEEQRGTFECPLCGKDYPHQHSPEELMDAKCPRCGFPRRDREEAWRTLRTERDAVKEEADYFKAAYARKLEDEKNALGQALALADALEEVALRTSVGPPSPPGRKSPPDHWYGLLIEINAFARAAIAYAEESCGT